MDYITARAHVIYTLAEGDGQPDESDIGLYRLYAVLSFAKGQLVDAEDVHDAWVAWRVEHFHDHRSAIPFAQLSETVQQMDDKYVDAIHKAARDNERFTRDL
jgi:hypothetical protein